MTAFKRMAECGLAGKRVFIRADFNVPQDEAGAITDDTRIRASLPCIRPAPGQGAAGMVTPHPRRPSEGKISAADPLAPIPQRPSEPPGREGTPITEREDT